LEKERIYYHRSYRKIERPKNWKLLVFTSFLFFSFAFVICLFLPKLTYLICVYTKSLIPVENIEILKSNFIFRDIYLLSFPGKFPTLYFSKIVATISFLAIVIFPSLKIIPKNFSIWIAFASFIMLVSSLFFVFFSYRFPYTLTDFSELYVKTEIVIWWFLIPFVISFFTILLPEKFINKFFLLIIVLSYGIVFGTVRYFVFLYVLWKFSYIFMAPLFLIFGPLVDFLYIVGIYSYYLSLLAIKLGREKKVWVWT